MRVLVLTPGELTRDPRARRQAQLGLARGCEVIGLGAGLDRGEPIELEGVRVIRAGGPTLVTSVRVAGIGGMGRTRPAIRELRGLVRLARLPLTTVRVVRAGRPLGRFDVIHANDFDTLPAALLLARRGHSHVVYDAHEIYAEQEPDPPRVHRAVTAWLEALLARRADTVVTVSEPIAAELTTRFSLDRPALWILNAPPRADPPESTRDDTRPLRVIYQGAMGPGRPLEDLLVAAEHATNVELTLRVAGADVAALKSAVAARGIQDRVAISEPVPPHRLLEGLAGFDVGLIINRPVTRNDELVFPNKLFEYMMAGLAVVAPRLEGLGPFVDSNGIGATYEPGRPDLLGAALVELAGDRDRVAAAGRRAHELALGEFNAETQGERLAAVWKL
jgi:glycosyltransferase involved in cell wall biosynthesis